VPSVFGKLNLKDQREIVLINVPASFEREVAALAGVVVHRDSKKLKVVDFSLAFVTTQSELDRLSNLLAKKAADDALLWFAYPKGTSRRYECEINRDHGWQALYRAGFRKVRLVAIDEDWSALRFRRVAHVRAKGVPTQKSKRAAR
jgi:hypothetical protein